MGSYIKEFKEDRQKNSDIIITIDGMAAVGKGTLAEFISNQMKLEHFSASDVFYQVAEERGLDDHELSEEAEKDLDLEIDRRTLERALNQDCIVEGRIPSHVLGSYSDFRIRIKADPEEKIERLKDRENLDREEAVKIVEKRDKEDSRRYKEYYNLDMSNLQIYDLVIDNTELEIEEQNRLVKKALKQRFPSKFEEDH